MTCSNKEQLHLQNKILLQKVKVTDTVNKVDFIHVW